MFTADQIISAASLADTHYAQGEPRFTVGEDGDDLILTDVVDDPVTVWVIWPDGGSFAR